jgi:hypothetical protein
VRGLPRAKTIAQLIISSSGVREAPCAAPGARQALQSNARNQNERKVLEDQIAISE